MVQRAVVASLCVTVDCCFCHCRSFNPRVF